MRATIGLAALLLTACGRLDFELIGPATDGGNGDGGGDTATPCTSFGTWSTPTPLPLSGIAHYMGSVTDDGLMMIYANYNGANADDLYVLTRSSPTDAWGPEMLVTELQTVDNDYSPATHDGLTVYFAREIGGANPDVFVTTRATRTAMFSTPVPVPELNSAASYDAPGWLSADGLRMFIASDAATPSIDIYMAERTATTTPFSTPASIGVLQGAGLDSHPVLTQDELEIIWSSRRASSTYDLYHATRASRTDQFGMATPINELKTANDDAYPSLSLDGQTMYFNYDFLTTGGNAPVYVTTRACQ